MSSGWVRHRDGRYAIVRQAEGSTSGGEEEVEEDVAVVNDFGGGDGEGAGGGQNEITEPLEIEPSVPLAHPVAVLPCRRWTFRRLAAACCGLLLLLCLSVSIAAAYIGGLVPHFHFPSRSCPELDERDRLQSGPLELQLNREARVLMPTDLEELHGAHFGFVWNRGDNRTKKWYPQGIATLEVRSDDAKWSGNKTISEFDDDSADFVLVSWYGRIDQQYFDRGARVSFVKLPTQADPLNMTAPVTNQIIPYRHVLLVDKHWDTFPFLHAGGLTVDPSTKLLHVPDSRYPWNYRIHVFDPLRSLYGVPPCHRTRFYNYAYVLQESHSYSVPIKPSFLSYDVDRGYMVTGTYAHCPGETQHVDSEPCRRNEANQLAWFSLSEQQGRAQPYAQKCSPFFADMQGAASARIRRNQTPSPDGTNATDSPSPDTEKSVLWIVSSYSAKNASHLHVVHGFDPDAACDEKGRLRSGDVADFDITTLAYPPPGLEDLHIQVSEHISTQRNLWMLTEFRSRTVFATSIEVFI